MSGFDSPEIPHGENAAGAGNQARRARRRDVAIHRAEATVERTTAAVDRKEAIQLHRRAAGLRAEAALERCCLPGEGAPPEAGRRGLSAAERERLADERDHLADEHDRLADEWEAVAYERDRIADQRDRIADDRDSLARERATQVHSDVELLASLRLKSAQAAERFADTAEDFAALLERLAVRGDTARRLKLAEAEREVAKIERRNAAKLREAGSGPVRLEHLPNLTAFESPDEPSRGSPPDDGDRQST